MMNKECLTTFVLVVFGLICFIWMINPNMSVTLSKEPFETSEEEQSSNSPQLDPNTGSIMDGPGFEAGEVQGAQETSVYTVPANYYFLDDGANGEMSVQHNLCSKSCCSEQWPTPFKLKYDPYVCENKNQFVPSRMMCNTTFGDSGCMCLTRKQASFLSNRGGNGREWF